jgi:hypothetical protein
MISMISIIKCNVNLSIIILNTYFHLEFALYEEKNIINKKILVYFVLRFDSDLTECLIRDFFILSMRIFEVKWGLISKSTSRVWKKRLTWADVNKVWALKKSIIDEKLINGRLWMNRTFFLAFFFILCGENKNLEIYWCI